MYKMLWKKGSIDMPCLLRTYNVLTSMRILNQHFLRLQNMKQNPNEMVILKLYQLACVYIDFLSMSTTYCNSRFLHVVLLLPHVC